MKECCLDMFVRTTTWILYFLYCIQFFIIIYFDIGALCNDWRNLIIITKNKKTFTRTVMIMKWKCMEVKFTISRSRDIMQASISLHILHSKWTFLAFRLLAYTKDEETVFITVNNVYVTLQQILMFKRFSEN